MPTTNNDDFQNIIEIKTEEAFNQMLQHDKAILYFHVDWSGPEIMSRRLLTKALVEIGLPSIPVFKINASEQDQIFVKDWLLKRGASALEFYYGGSGETVLIENGNITDFIKYPALLGLEKTKEKLKSWQKIGH